MPNPVPLATREDEERRAWVTTHHEVVRLIKDCFGDRFSNNEIFDRLKISRRTGYRALGNDERIGKAPGRKPKITEATIREMIEYIETGGCNDVGNVWKHLSEKFAPDCNPKTVQDAVKKSGFKNYRASVKLEPLLTQDVNENQPAQEEEEDYSQMPPIPIQQQQQIQPVPQMQQAQQTQNQQQYQNVIDPAFQQGFGPMNQILQQTIENALHEHVRQVLWDICCRFPDVENYAMNTLFPFVSPPHGGMSAPPMSTTFVAHTDDPLQKTHRPRIAVCRRCGSQYDRSENTMENRQCLYHKGSHQKIQPNAVGTIEEAPEAYIWSCCGGNGMVRGCCRAMHTTKKKRKYGKKRDAGEAELDNEGDGDDDGQDDDNHTPELKVSDEVLRNAPQSHINDMAEQGMQNEQQQHIPTSPMLQVHEPQMELPRQQQQQLGTPMDHRHLLDSRNIDRLQDLQPTHQITIDMFGVPLQGYDITTRHMQAGMPEAQNGLDNPHPMNGQHQLNRQHPMNGQHPREGQISINGQSTYQSHDTIDMSKTHMVHNGNGLPPEYQQFASVQMGQHQQQ